MTPMAQMSTGLPCPAFLKTSGAMYPAERQVKTHQFPIYTFKRARPEKRTWSSAYCREKFELILLDDPRQT